MSARNSPCRGCKILPNLFDYDGSSIAEKQALKKRVEELEQQVQFLTRQIKRYQSLLGEDK